MSRINQDTERLLLWEDRILGHYQVYPYVLDETKARQLARKICRMVGIKEVSVIFVDEDMSRAHDGFTIFISRKSVNSLYVMHEMAHIVHWWLVNKNILAPHTPKTDHDPHFLSVLIYLYKIIYNEDAEGLILSAIQHQLSNTRGSQMSIFMSTLRRVLSEEKGIKLQ